MRRFRSLFNVDTDPGAFHVRHAIAIRAALLVLLFVCAGCGAVVFHVRWMSFLVRPMAGIFHNTIFTAVTDILKPAYLAATGMLLVLPFAAHFHLTLLERMRRPAQASFSWMRLFLLAVWFFGGALLGLYVVLPAMMRLVSTTAGMPFPQNISVVNLCVMILKVMTVCGFLLMLPFYFLLAKRAGLLFYKNLSRQRRWIAAGIFLAAAMATPPDVVTFLMMALPLYLYCELCIQLMRFGRQPSDDETTGRRSLVFKQSLVLAACLFLAMLPVAGIGMPELFGLLLLVMGMEAVYLYYHVFKDSLLQGLLCIVVPFYGPVFILSSAGRLFPNHPVAKIWAWGAIALNLFFTAGFFLNKI